jgi:hypothetical protein
MRKISSILFVLGLAGCVETQPIVSDYNGASVKIQTDMFTAEANAKTQAEADRICKKNGKHAEYASSRSLPDYVYEHLYLCL